MRRLHLGLLGALATPALAVTVTYDSTKGGPCTWDAPGTNLVIACPATTSPQIGFSSGVRETFVKGGVEYIRFTVARNKSGPVLFSHSENRLTLDLGPATSAPGEAIPLAPPTTGAPVTAKTAGTTAAPVDDPSQLRPVIPAKTPAVGQPNSSGSKEQASTSAQKLANDLKDLQFDYSIPDMPAFTVLGLTPENVVQPRTARALVAALKNGVDQNGKLKTGLAIEFAPFRLADPSTILKSYLQDAVDQKPYTSNSLNQAFNNMSVSIATAQGTGSDDKSIRLGLGVNIPLIDKSDGRTDIGLAKCYSRSTSGWFKNKEAAAELQNEIAAAQKRNDEAATNSAKAALAKLEKDGNTNAIDAANACYKERTSARWNATVWTLSLGNAWTSDSGNFSDRKTATRGVWTTYAYGFEGNPVLEKSAQLLFHLRAVDRERVPDAKVAGKFVNQDSRIAGLALKFGREDFNGTLHASQQRMKLDGGGNTEKVRKFALGLEYKISEGTWLVGTFGGESGRTNGENKSFVNAGFKYALSKTPTFSPVQSSN